MRYKLLLKLSSWALVIALVSTACQNVTNTTEETSTSPDIATNIENQYIVKLRSTADNPFQLGKANEIDEVRSSVLQEAGISRDNVITYYDHAIAGFTATLTPEQAERLKMLDVVEYIEQDRIVTFAPPCGTPNGGPCDGGGGGDDGGSGQETPYGITRVNGGVTYTGSNVAWILDSGVDLDHPDLNVDASRGFNAFTSGKDGRSLDDGDGHGTHVAGTIAAIDNSTGVIGVAAGATVIPVKVLDSRGSGSYSGVIGGVDHVAANGNAGDVANMSLGGPFSQALNDAVEGASSGGVKFVLAAGNESTDANNRSPASANGNNVYTISAMNSSDNWASYSNYGNPPVDYCAPGTGILSTYRNGGYATLNGTSMAAPHAAGVLLLGNPSTDGTVNGDPDGNADPIIVH
ncbi:S8 family serine peptidase [Balneola sp. MJW-20]|uniref:S8 family serine peptidase n=1 Tax=Gracilimonas aurantiaca TaxID=3234185 RepID=UPI0034663E2D